MPYKVLIVEDNPANRILMKDLLEYYGFEVLTADCSADGIQLAASEQPDLILMDIQMPKVSGIDAIKELKTHPETRDIPIIAVTSFAMPGDREKLLALGADEYISKPINTRTVPQMIRNLLEKESPQ